MKVVRSAVASAIVAAGVGIGGSAQALDLVEVPSLKADVDGGKVPAIGQRVPEEPLVVDLEAQGLKTGRYGGKIDTLLDKARSIRYMVVWGYARLVGYTPDLELKPDILKDVTVDNDRVFTLRLRKGHKWSDGKPFTSEDFRYFWEDIANNPELSPAGPPSDLLVNGKAPKVEIVDEVTVRYSWEDANPTFLALLAGARPPFIYRPAHYLKRFHDKYGDKAEIDAAVAAARVRTWAALHNRNDDMYKFENPDLPTLQPWYNSTGNSESRFVLKRNPYFHRVDTKGQQLPYVDEVVATVAASKLIPAKTIAGETSLQARSLSFANIAILKHGERQGDYKVRLWPISKASHMALYPNLNTADPIWRNLLRKTDFRCALSIAIDRNLINRTLYLGLGQATGHSVLKQSPFYDPENSSKWAQYDPALANRLLDDLGLTKRDGDGFRLLPDGRRAEIIVETAGEDEDEVAMLQLVSTGWKEVGIKLFAKPSQRDVLRQRSYTGETVMTTWSGWDNGTPNADMSPVELAPTKQDNLAWPKWGQYHETSGQSGEAPDMGPAEDLLKLYHGWLTAADKGERERIWREMLKIHAEQAFIIGVISGVQQPVAVSNKLRNVPENGFFGWDPGAQFGIYHPDQFWLAD
jgi:peptide/nickel transport system substrate-binding protein